MEFVILFVAVFIGAGIGWVLREKYAEHVVAKYLKELEINKGGLSESEKESRTTLKLETHNDTIFAYDEEGTFIAQGADLDYLDRAIKARYPDRKFKVSEENLKEIGVL